MTECGPPKTGSAVCELPVQSFQRSPCSVNSCPDCGKTGKSIQRQTVSAMLSASLRAVQDEQYFFCRTQTCPVVYFSNESKQSFTVEQVRERVYQKEPEVDEVFICYCFRHTIGDLRVASPEDSTAIVEDINMGINAGQCACDLRNPQGSCCLGSVRSMLKHLEKPAFTIASAAVG
jgi:CopZ-like zinc binding protein